jgi:hypothetical protein
MGPIARGDASGNSGDGQGIRGSEFEMIDRARIHDMAKDKTPRWFASLGAGKPWRKSWFVLMGLLQSRTDEQFDDIEPRFKRAIQDFGVWMAKFKQDPRQHEVGSDAAIYFRDHDFALAFKILMGESDKWHRLAPGSRKFDVIQMIWRLREKLPHWPK